MRVVSSSQKKIVRRKMALAIAAGLMLMSDAVYGVTTTTTFSVQMTITASCTIVSASTLDFGSQGVLTANVDRTSTIKVQCTNTTPYDIGLDVGTGAGATVNSRKMTNSGNTVTYSLYSNSGRTTVWGNSVGSDTVA